MVTRPVSSNHRISIPADYWSQIAVNDGTNVDISVVRDTIVICKSINNIGIESQVANLKKLVQHSDLFSQDEIMREICTIENLLSVEKGVNSINDFTKRDKDD